MLRAIAAAVVAYIVIFVFIVATFSVAYVVMGTDGAFREGSYEVTPLWIAAMLGLGLIAAVLGGWTCARIAPRPLAPFLLIAIVVILSGIEISQAIGHEDPGPRTGDVALAEAGMTAKQPLWVSILNPVVGIAGILIGGRRAFRGDGAAR